jgi:hypothetical protein
MAHDDQFTATGPAFTGSGQAYSKRRKPGPRYSRGSYRPVDDFVAALVIAQLFQKDAADLLLIDDGRNLDPARGSIGASGETGGGARRGRQIRDGTTAR